MTNCPEERFKNEKKKKIKKYLKIENKRFNDYQYKGES